jgi:hypothetical protein
MVFNRCLDQDAFHESGGQNATAIAVAEFRVK